jgi:hypothetical protein
MKSDIYFSEFQTRSRREIMGLLVEDSEPEAVEPNLTSYYGLASIESD